MESGEQFQRLKTSAIKGLKLALAASVILTLLGTSPLSTLLIALSILMFFCIPPGTVVLSQYLATRDKPLDARLSVSKEDLVAGNLKRSALKYAGLLALHGYVLYQIVSKEMGGLLINLAFLLVGLSAVMLLLKLTWTLIKLGANYAIYRQAATDKESNATTTHYRVASPINSALSANFAEDERRTVRPVMRPVVAVWAKGASAVRKVKRSAVNIVAGIFALAMIIGFSVVFIDILTTAWRLSLDGVETKAIVVKQEAHSRKKGSRWGTSNFSYFMTTVRYGIHETKIVQITKDLYVDGATATIVFSKSKPEIALIGSKSWFVPYILRQQFGVVLVWTSLIAAAVASLFLLAWRRRVADDERLSRLLASRSKYR